MIRLSTNVLGAFALKNGKIIKHRLFPKDPVLIAERLEAIESKVCAEERDLIDDLISSGIKEFSVQNPSRFRGTGLVLKEDAEFIDPVKIGQEIGVSKKEVLELISQSNLELTKRKLRVLERDQILIQAVSSLDDIEEVGNRLIERLREWYSLHFPELDTLVKNHSIYAKLVADPEDSSVDKGLIEQLKQAKEETVGMEFSPSDLAEAKRLAEVANKLDAFRADTEAYIGELMNDVAPNTAELAGPLLGARLIAISGGLERMSRLPASTLQILGAEESFFRFLKTRTRPPKHGIIFQLPEIRSAPKHLRGKTARVFAAKLAIAAKADYFKGEFIGKKLREDFLSAVERNRKKPAKRPNQGFRQKKMGKKGFHKKKGRR